MIPRRSMNDGESHKSSRIDLPISNSSTETASMRNVSVTSSIDSSSYNGSRLPRTWRAYAAWLGCFFLMFNSWGLVNSYGTFSSYYTGNSLKSTDQMQLSLIGATQSFFVLLFSGPIGRLLDADHSRIIIATGTFLVPFGMFMLSVAHPKDDGQAEYIKIWLTQGLVTGLGMACFFVTSSQVAATWFPRMKGLATGFVACGASIAGVVYPTMLRFLIDAIGYNHAVQAVAGLITLTSVFSLIFATPNPAHEHRKPPNYRDLKIWIDVGAFRNPSFCWFTAAVAFLFFGFYPIFFNLEEWAAVHGYGTRNGSPVPMHFTTSSEAPLQTFWLLAILNGASTGGRVFMALCSDRIGPLNLHIGVQTVSSIFILVLWTLAGSEAAAIGFAVAFGITSGADIGLPPASMANILACTYNTPETRHLAHTKLGQWVGMMYSIAAIPALVGPIIGGHLVTYFDTYIGVQMWSGACLLVSAICMLVSRWYLPCVDGERVGTKLAGIFGRKSLFSEKGKNISDSDTECRATLPGFSRATTRVSSATISRQASENKLRTEGSEAVVGSEQNV